MHTIQLKSHKIEVYDSIDELPITRFHLFNRYLLIDAGIGSSLDDFDIHMIKLLKYLELGDTDNAKKEAMNIRQGVALMLDGISPEHNAFVPLIRSINGKPLDDMSDENIKAILKMIGGDGVTTSTLSKWVDEAKKKLRSSLTFSSRRQHKVRE